METGNPEDKTQESISDETTSLTLNMDQAVILHKALEVYSNDCRTKKIALKAVKLDDRQFSTEDINQIKEEMNLLDFIAKKLPYLQSDVKEAIIYLQKESDSTIKGIIKS